jgi:hypothetical protein
MQNARHLAEAARTGGVLWSDANSKSNIVIGEVTNLRRCVAMGAAISRKLCGAVRKKKKAFVLIYKPLDKDISGLKSSFLNKRVNDRSLIAQEAHQM